MRFAAMVVAAGLALMGTTAAAQEVTYDYDKGTDFSRLKTYAWVRGTPVNDELNHKRIVDALDEQLAAKGLSLARPGTQPDLYVAYHAGVDSELQVSGWDGRRVRASYNSARVEKIMIGLLGLEIMDGKTKAVIWRGLATKEMDVKASREKREKNINKAAEKLLKQYPPVS